MRSRLRMQVGKQVLAPLPLPRSMPISALDVTIPHESHFDSAQDPELRPPATILNVEEVLAIEGKLQAMIDGMRTGDDVTSVCEDYWKLCDNSDLARVPALFLDLRTQRQMHKAQLAEVVGVALVHFFAAAGGANVVLVTHLKNLLFYLHQNFLGYVEAMLARLHPDSSKNVWVEALSALLTFKRLKHVRRSHLWAQIRQYTEIISSISRGIVSTLLSNPKLQYPVFQMVLRVLRGPEAYTVEKARMALRSAIVDAVLALPPPVVETASMPTVVPPYLPPAATTVRYTLVLDLDETLVHYSEVEGSEGSFKVRPFCDTFLHEMSRLYELAIFTAAVQDVIVPQYADWVLDKIDPDKCISHRLYRQHTQMKGTVFTKDLKLLGRNLAKVIIVDNVAENFQMQKENGIFVRSWFDDMDDRELLNLMPLLTGKQYPEIARRQVVDVRIALSLYRDQLLRSALSPSPALNTTI